MHNFTPIIPFKLKLNVHPLWCNTRINEECTARFIWSVYRRHAIAHRSNASFWERSFPHHESQYVSYIPSSRPLSCLLAVSNIFSVPFWLAVVAMMILVPAIMWPSSNCSLEYQSQERMSNAFYNMWVICTAILVTCMPRTFRLAALIKPWICYCLATSTVFQAFFTSYLVNPGLEIKSQLLRISQTHKWSSDIETVSLSRDSTL